MDAEVIYVIDAISKRIKMNQIYISGSFRKISKEEEEFSTKLARHLTSNILKYGYRICNGVGKGIGSRIVGYASEWLIENNQPVDKRIILRSRSFHNHKGINDTTKDYRKYTMKDSGIALFMFGQGKQEADSSNGVRQEFIVAKETGMKIIPLGITGYESLKIWNEIDDNISSYGYLEKYMQALKIETDAEKLANIVMAIINDVQ
jgi:hypothetical protein